MSEDTRNNLSSTQRMGRVILSLGLVTATVAGEGTIGMLAILPLLAIYPGITGFLGRDPLSSLIGRMVHRHAGESIVRPTAHAT